MTAPFPHRHLFSIAPLSQEDIQTILERGAHYAARNRSANKKCDLLAGKIIVNMFFEDSTRTRTSFEVAAKRLGADVVNFNAALSSMNKGETFADTIRVINAMNAEGCVIRHKENGRIEEATRYFENTRVLNAGDGTNEHPTQALLDALTITRHKGSLEGLKIAVIGDISHSRVAGSDVLLWQKFGCDIRFFAPPQYAVADAAQKWGVRVCSSMEEALDGVDVIGLLRIQNERLKEGEAVFTAEEYHRLYGLNHERLKPAKKDVIIIHPAPVNRGVEITSELLDDKQYSAVFEQMEMGVATRMACLDLLLSSPKD